MAFPHLIPFLMRKNFLRLGALLCAVSVLFGAFGAHGLKEIISADQLAIFETAVRYQFIHAIALLIVGILLYFRKTSWMPIAGWLFFGGIVCFSGSLYLLSIREIIDIPASLIGPITPIGGLLFVAGWITLLASTYQTNEKRYRKAHSDK